MTDYGHDLAFGTTVTPTAASPDQVLRLAGLSEELGFDVFSVQDHPYQPRHLDAWTLLAVVAARTTTLRVMPNVINLPLRLPSVLAGSAASLDILSGGRVELGLGAGAFWDAISSMGGPRRSPAESVDALREAIAVIRAMWDVSRRTHDVADRHYRLDAAHPGPAPSHDIPIMLGAYKDRMLRLTGELADGWLPSSPYAAPDTLARSNAVIDVAATDAGRTPGHVRRVYNITGTFARRGAGFLNGPPPMWAEQLSELCLDHGMSEFIVMGDDPDMLRRFAGEVMPAVRESVDAARQGHGRVHAESPSPELHPDRRNRLHATLSPPAVTSASAILKAMPTRDDGRRLSAVAYWDEAARPTAPEPAPEQNYTSAQVAAGRELVDVHNHLRSELGELRKLVEQVAAGDMSGSEARSHINAMTMRQNHWTLGTYCESYCRIVTIHHGVEDSAMFPRLRRAEPELTPVLDRLEAEHRAIHDMLEAVDSALVILVGGADGFGALQQAVDVLTDGLLSHLAYEERELVEPLARTN